jgi:hypothetical protein
VAGSFSITKKAATVTAGGGTKVYGTTPDPALSETTQTGFLAADEPGITLASTRASGENVDDYVTTATATGGNVANYDVTYVAGSFSITKKAATVTAGGGTKVYGTTPDPALSATTQSGFVAADLPAITLSSTRAPGESVGSYPTTASALGAPLANYDVTYIAGAFTITKAPATVTASSGTKVYGNADPDISATATGFLAADNITVSATRAPGESVGSYVTTPTATGDLSNYSVSYVAGALSITPRPITVTADPQSKILGAADPPLTYQVTGTLAFSDSFSGALTRAAGETVGAYPIQQGTLALSPNYTLTYVGANLNILYSTDSCLGSPGHTILQPIDVDGSSVFKWKSTVPAKFRVCDANGNSVGTPGVVSSFRLIQTVSAVVAAIDEAVDSTTPDTVFRWTGDQWIFNIATKTLAANKIYVYRITLNDGSTIDFRFALK